MYHYHSYCIHSLRRQFVPRGTGVTSNTSCVISHKDQYGGTCNISGVGQYIIVYLTANSGYYILCESLSIFFALSRTFACGKMRHLPMLYNY